MRDTGSTGILVLLCDKCLYFILSIYFITFFNILNCTFILKCLAFNKGKMNFKCLLLKWKSKRCLCFNFLFCLNWWNIRRWVTRERKTGKNLRHSLDLRFREEVNFVARRQNTQMFTIFTLRQKANCGCGHACLQHICFQKEVSVFFTWSATYFQRQLCDRLLTRAELCKKYA